jgi:integrase
VLVGTGLPPSEALALTWRDVDLVAGALTVRRSLGWVRGEKRFVFNDPKTPSSRRTIPLPLGLVRVLTDHLEGADLDDSVFRARSGNPAHQRTIVQEAFKPALERAGLSKDVRLYDLRHTHATLLLLAGVHPKVVSERLGHSSVAITLDVYSHVLPNMQAEAAEKLDALLYGDQVEEQGEVRVAN